MENFDFIGPADKPALVCISDRERQQTVRQALEAAGYKVHVVTDAALFQARFFQVNYEVVVLDQVEDAAILECVETMPMAHRRHATFLLLGAEFETLNSLQAFTRSVHCVVHYSQLNLIGRLIEKTVAENRSFLAPFQEIQQQVLLKTR
jgi:PleD family two-component response regulator